MKALILNAGQGRRLLPLTATRPKCLLPVGGRTVIEWQIQELLSYGIRDINVVIGFGAQAVRKTLAATSPPIAKVTTIYNPFFDSSDNLVSCWMAREVMDDDFLLINGDTLFERAVLGRLLPSKPSPITIAIDRKSRYDADDMKVQCNGSIVRRIGKELLPHQANAESIGMLLFRGHGPRLFREALEWRVEGPGAIGRWYLSVVDELAREGLVKAVSVEGLDWTEIDFPRDLQNAMQLVAGWTSVQPIAASSA